MITVGVVDDHMIVHDGIRAMAERTEDIAFWGAASSGPELLELLEQGTPDVLLLDLRIASENGFDLCRAVRKRHTSVRIVVFTAHGSAALLRASVDAGAIGYILKDASTRRLPDILRHVRVHGAYFDPRLSSEMVLAAARPDEHPAGPDLTERELMVLRLIADGRTNAEIADALHFSYHTIKLSVTRLLEKFGVERRTELARIASERRLTTKIGLDR